MDNRYLRADGAVDGANKNRLDSTHEAQIVLSRLIRPASQVTKKLQLHTSCASIIILTGHLTYGTVYLTIPGILFCLIKLIRLNLDLINSDNIKMLFMISKPKFMEPEVGVVIGY